MRTDLIIRVASLGVWAIAMSAGPTKTEVDIPVTTYLSDYNASSSPYYVQSDASGAYSNGLNTVTSILVGNGYNSIEDGDWRLDLSNSTIRTARVTFEQANAVQPGDPGYTAPANPPYWGTEFEPVRMENKCTAVNHDLLIMKPGDKFTCPMLIRFPPWTSTTFYRLQMGFPATKTLSEPETQPVQVSCNSADAGGCNDWFIDPIPVVNPDGSTSPGQTRARLDLVSSTKNNILADEGDFYLTFHFHATRP